MRSWLIDISGFVRWLAIVAVVCGIVLRVAVAFIPGAQIEASWSGGGDSAHYVTLAKNLSEGKGFSYAGRPTAIRPPLYPVIIAGFMGAFGSLWPAGLRAFQIILGLATAFLTARLSAVLFGQRTYVTTFLLVLYLPTSIYLTAQVGTEILTAFLLSVFAHSLVHLKRLGPGKAGWFVAVWSGAAAGLAGLVRFPSIVLLPAALILLQRRNAFRVLLILLACIAMLSPWIARNRAVLGAWAYSTSSGVNLVMGVLDPQGRGRGDTSVREFLGWIHQEYEQNDRSATYPPETEMDRSARAAYSKLVREKGKELIPLHLQKISWFWLGLDQWLDPGVQGRAATIRKLGVVAWWGLLVLAGVGFFALRARGSPDHHFARNMFLVWFGLITLGYLPFCMNTRLRAPMVDGLVAALAANGLASIWAASFRKDRSQASAPLRKDGSAMPAAARSPSVS